MTRSSILERIKNLKREMDQLKANWPPHTTSPVFMQRWDELERELAEQEERLKEVKSTGSKGEPHLPEDHGE
ncbi:MAG: hypothetical protein KGY46_06110 [Anaerolineales bacterium]|nr:hypothetical protein [Anaerolineales bacterium]